MRALVLVLLVGGLGLLVWLGLRSVQAGEGRSSGEAEQSAPGEAPAQKGRLLARGDAPVLARQPDPLPAAEPVLEAEPEPVERPADDERRAAPEAAAPEPVAAPSPSDSIDFDTAAARERPGPDDGVALARCLLHRPHELPGLLQAQALSEPRQKLVLAYAHALAGRADRARELARELEGEAEIATAEIELLTRLDGSTGGPIPASATRASLPLVRAAGMAWLASESQRWLAERQFAEAADGFSELLQAELNSPWAAETEALARWTAGLREAQARHRWSLRGAWPSFTLRVEPGDSLVSIRKRALEDRPDLQLCTGLIGRANELSGSVIQPGQELRVPTDPVHVLVDLSARWVLYFHGDEVVDAWLVGVGSETSETRPGLYTVGDKQEEPAWFRPGHEPVPFGDPENPLGTRWIAWVKPDGNNSSLGFHGTNDPAGVGGALSQGCIRMRNEDVEELFEILPRGATVEVRP